MMNITFTGIAANLRAKQARIEAEERIAKFEQENELLMAQLVPAEEDIVVEETVTQEDIELELMMMDQYRDFTLDISTTDEVEWINNNIDLNFLVGSKYNTVEGIARALNISATKAKRLVRSGLGYKLGSDYQQDKKQYVDDLILDFRHSLYEDLEKQLRRSNLYNFYRALLDYVKYSVSVTPLGQSEDDLVFIVSYDELIRTLKEFGVKTGLGKRAIRTKLEKLCNLKLLTSLQDEQLSEEEQIRTLTESVVIGNMISTNVGKGKEVEVNTRNHYILNDLSPQNQDEIIARLKFEKESGFRVKDKCSTSYTLLYGEEESKTILAKGKADTSDTKLRNFNRAAKQLLDKQRWFNEDQLRKTYLKFDKHTKAKDSGKLTRTYLAKTVVDNNCIKVRVNAEAREEYSLPASIKSNSFIFVKKSDLNN